MTEGIRAAVVLGRAAARTHWSELPEVVRANALDILLDTIAVMTAGSDSSQHAALRMLYASGSGRSTVLGRAEPGSVAEAVLLNGTLPTVYQLDEGYRASRGHPGIHIVPVILALAEERGSRADELLSALVAGYEVAARIGVSLGGTLPDIHPHGNWGAVGAAMAAAHLLSNGDEAAVTAAIDIASGVAGYPDRRAATLGEGVHHLWAAIGAHTGLVAGSAAVAGMTPVPGALEDYLLTRSGVSPDASFLSADIDHATGTWSQHATGANYIKFWAACGHTHTAIGAILAVMDRHPLTGDDIDSIEVSTFRAAANLSRIPVENDLAARYSIPYVVAAAVLDGGFGIGALRPERLRAPELHDLAARVQVRHDSNLDAGYPSEGRPLHMAVTLTDGTVIREEQHLSYGDAERPASRADIHAKTSELFAHRFGVAAARRILDAGLALENGGSLEALSEELRSSARKDGP